MKIRFLFVCSVLVFLLSAKAQIISTIAGTGMQGYSGDHGSAKAASFYNCQGIAADRSGNLYIADYWAHVVRKINPSGIITTVAGTGFGAGSYSGGGGFSGDNGPAIAAELNFPSALAVDTLGNIYICDGGNFRIRKVDAKGIITTFAGNGIQGSTGDKGPANAAEIQGLSGLALDQKGNLYINDGNAIRKVNAAQVISTYAGNGTAGYSGDQGPASSARLNAISGISSDYIGNLFVADFGNYVIRKINAAGIISTYAGNGTSGNTGNKGPATAAALYPTHIASDGLGNVFIEDNLNCIIRKVDSSGTIDIYAGYVHPQSMYIFSGDGGPATWAMLNFPAALATDLWGHLFLADRSNDRIREITYCSKPAVLHISGPSHLCGGKSALLTASGAPSYTWSPNAGNAKTDTVTLMPGTSQTYTVESIRSTCFARDTISIALDPILHITQNGSVCPGTAVLLTASGASAYSWSGNAGNANTDTVTVFPVVTSTYTVTASLSGCTNMQTYTVPIHSYGGINFPICNYCTGQYMCAPAISKSNNAICYQLPKCDSALGHPGFYNFYTVGSNYGVNTYTVMPGNLIDSLPKIPSNTVYTVTIKDGFGCSYDTTFTVIDCATGITPLNENKMELHVFPNPANAEIQITLQGGAGKQVTIHFVNSLGQIVYKSEEWPDSESFIKNINIRSLPSGLYFLRLEQEGEIRSCKVIKE
jgi:hypothetical protein